MNAPVYLDHHAATPVCPEAERAMTEARREAWANPSSAHTLGRAARAHLERARERVARAIGAAPADVVLTSGGTEACALGLLGLRGVDRVVTTGIEHPAVAGAVARLRAAGAEVHVLSTPGGRPPASGEVLALARPGALLAVGFVNHETGNVLPVADLAAAATRQGATVFVDACQALGKVPVDVQTLDAHLVAVASPKVGGPAGAGALWVRRGLSLTPLAPGGGQERGRRPGSPDPVAHAGFGGACDTVPARLGRMAELGDLRDALEAALVRAGGQINGAAGPRVATCVNASLPTFRSDLLVAALDLEGVCASAGAACSSGLGEPSPVLRAMYPEAPERASSALRLTLGAETTPDDVERARDALARVLERGRGGARRASSGF